MMSKKLCVSGIVLIRELFLWTFWKKIFIFSKSCLNIIHRWTNWLSSVFTKLLIFLWVLFPVKLMSLEETLVKVCLIIALAIWVLERVGAQFSLLCFKPRRVSFGIHFTTPSEMIMMFRFMGTIALYTLRSLNSAWRCHMTPFLVVLTLRYFWVHICIYDDYYVAFNIEAPIDQFFSLVTALNIPNVKPDNSHVWFGGDFDYTRF